MTEGFAEAYKETVFYVWYDNNRPGMGRLYNYIEPDNRGQKPTEQTLTRWRDEEEWAGRADALDAQISVVQDENAIQRRLKMFEKQAAIAEEMTDMGIEYLRKNGIESDTAAINAISKGVQIMQVSVGLAQMQAKIAGMTSTQLDKELRQLIGNGGMEDVVDTETEEVGDDTSQ